MPHEKPQDAPGSQNSSPEAGNPPDKALTAQEPSQEKPEPPCGRFPWHIRACAPGLDQTAIEAKAIEKGYMTSPKAPPGILPPDKEAGGMLAEFMPYAFASAYDHAVAYRLGLNLKPLDSQNLEALLAFSYALCLHVTGEHSRAQAQEEQERLLQSPPPPPGMPT